MKVTRFDPGESLIVVRGTVWGAAGRRADVRLVVDTGAAETLVLPGVLDALGYSPSQGEAMTIIRSAIGSEPGYLIRVTRLRSLGHEFADFRVHAHELPEGFGIDGLLGMSFLRHLDFTIHPREGRILAHRPEST